MKKIIECPSITEPVISLATDITYAHVPYWYGCTERPLKMSLLFPKRREAQEKALPCFIFLCGGGVQVMDKDIWVPELVYWAKRGFVVASVQYRTFNDAVFPAQIEDAKAAVRFLRAHAARFCIDPEKIAISGESAGGNIATCVGVYNNVPEYDVGDYLDYSSHVNAVVSYYGGGGERAERWRKAQSRIDSGEGYMNTIAMSLGGTPEQIPEVYDKASVLYHIQPGLPPLMILHGTQDGLSPIELVEPFYEKMLEAGNVCEYYIFQGAEHGDDRMYQPAAKDLVIDFLNRNL